MNIINKYFRLAGVFAFGALTFSACTTDPNSPGTEYMPDMYRSPAIEAYVDYGMDDYHFGDSLVKAQRNTPSARKPVAGTIPFEANAELAIINNMPYKYENTNEGYELAGVELSSPIAFDEANIADGKYIYQRFCLHCHGKEGKGDGLVVTKAGHAAPGAYDGALSSLSEGKMYHTITFGKGMMGSHASQLNPKERWQVIQYVKTLQGLSPVVATEEDAE